VGQLRLGVIGATRKENERRLPIHPYHIDRIDADVRASIYLEGGTGSIAASPIGSRLGGRNAFPRAIGRGVRRHSAAKAPRPRSGRASPRPGAVGLAALRVRRI
jgi:hypothetical protein